LPVRRRWHKLQAAVFLSSKENRDGI